MLRKPRSLVRGGAVYCPCGCTGQIRTPTLRAREKARWKKETR